MTGGTFGERMAALEESEKQLREKYDGAVGEVEKAAGAERLEEMRAAHEEVVAKMRDLERDERDLARRQQLADFLVLVLRAGVYENWRARMEPGMKDGDGWVWAEKDLLEDGWTQERNADGEVMWLMRRDG